MFCLKLLISDAKSLSLMKIVIINSNFVRFHLFHNLEIFYFGCLIGTDQYNDLETKMTIEEISESKSWFLEK